MFERFLERLSLSEYREKFVVKGGMLIAAIVGLDTRSTMDLDTTLRNMPLTEEQIYNAIRTICDINIEDDVIFEIQSVNPIRKDDVYVLVTTQKYDKVLFKEALNATAIHRGTAEKIEDTAGILTMISQSNELKSMWNKYRKKFIYAEDISYEMIMKVLKNVLT